MKNALIIGGDSTIGNAFASWLAEKNIPHTMTGRRGTPKHIPLDLSTPPEEWPPLPAAEVAFLAAAITKLDICETQRDATYKINVAHMKALTEKLQAQGTFIAFLSSNQVFDGNTPLRKTTDAPSPVNEYGRQKAEFEAWLLARPHPAAVLRLSKVIADPLPLLPRWEQSLKSGEPIEAFEDLVFAPLPLHAVLAAMLELGSKKTTGIFHLSGTKDISYVDIARLLAKKIGADASLVKSAKGMERGIPATFLPKHGTLESSFPAIPIAPPEEVVFTP